MRNKILDDLGRMLFIDNDRCPICKKILWKKDQYLCPKCLKNLPKNDARICPRCGKPIVSGDAELCKSCRDHTDRPIERGWVWLVYGPAAGQIASGFKFKHQKTLAYWSGTQMAEGLADCPWIADIDMLVPVPLHPSRLAERGYNQSEQLAAGIASGLKEKGIDIPVNGEALRRVVNTPHQLGQAGIFRQENVKTAFCAAQSEQIRGKNIALVDDVMTTGATLDACAAALKAAGAAAIAAITFAAVAS